jgi:hypothetical protein
VHVRDVELGVTRRAHGPQCLTLRDAFICGDDDRPEMEQGDSESVGGPDRDRQPVGRQPAGERHPPRRGGRDDRARRAADIDPAVPVLLVLLAAEVEPAQDRSVDRPAPGMGAVRRGQRREDYEERRCRSRQHRRPTLASRPDVVKDGYRERS